MELSSSSAPHTPSNVGLLPSAIRNREEDGLRVDLAARYDLARRILPVADTSFTVTVVRDTNALLDRIGPEEFARDERLPYWADVWSSSLELARWALEGGVRMGMRVLELGCGVGLAGIAAARAGGLVMMTDYEPDALDFARLNAAENLHDGQAERTVRFALLDWRTPYKGRRFPLVIGSDIIYDRALFEPLMERFDECLSRRGRVILTDPDRSIGRAFLEHASRQGFVVESSAVPTLSQGRMVTVVRTMLCRREAK